MSESIVQYFVTQFGDKASPELITFIISMLPILELRGGLIAAKLMGVSLAIFTWLKRFDKIEHMIDKLEARSIRKADKVKKYRLWGLFLFVAIPLPGTGAWTGALVADLFDIRIKKSFPVIAIGVAVAGLIISILSYGLLGAFGL